MSAEIPAPTSTSQKTVEPTSAVAPSTPSEKSADFDKRLEFLYKAHEDNQNLIRFLDAKAAFAVAILAAMVNKVLSGVGLYFPWGAQPHWRQILVLGFGLTTIIASILVVLILFPITNPALNVRLIAATNGPTFFLTQLNPRRWLRIFSRSPNYSRLAQEHSEYLNQVKAVTNAVLLESISGEVLKVAYIRQIKTDRLRAVTIVLASCVIFFVLLMGTDAILPQPNKPTLVQVQGPVTLNPPAANASSQVKSSVTPANSTPPASGSAGTPNTTPVSKDTPAGSTKQ